jgi:hypothetical protein
MRSQLSLLAFVAAAVSPVAAQFPPKPEGVTVLKSKFDERITISYKAVCLAQISSIDSTLTSISPAFVRQPPV